MMEQTFKSLSDILALRSVRRTLWYVLGVLVIIAVLESQTQFLAIQSLTQRAELVSTLASHEYNAEQRAQLEFIQGSIIEDLREIQEQHNRPTSNVFTVLMRFLQGAWVVFPLVWLLFKVAKRTITDLPIEQRPHAIWFGWYGFSYVAWLATMLGMISIIFNRSNGFFFSWFVFPPFSALVLVFIIFWFSLLKTIVPDEKKISPKS